jgi:site-specific DNA-methyltransferase (cytosine-N4-specific)
MQPYYQTPDLTLYQGHVLDVLAQLPAGSVQCVVTSPPY